MFDANVFGGLLATTALTWATEATVSTASTPATGSDTLRVFALDSTHFLTVFIDGTSHDVILRVGSVAADGTITFGTAVTITDLYASSAGRHYASCVTVDGKVVVVYAKSTSTCGAKSYTISGTSLTLDATASDFTIGGSTADNVCYGLISLSSTRLMAVIPRSTTGQRQALGMTIGSGTLSFDATGTQIALVTSDDPSGNTQSRLLRVDSTHCYAIGSSAANGNVQMNYLTDNGSGSPPTVSTGTEVIDNLGAVVYFQSGLLYASASAVLVVGADGDRSVQAGIVTVSGATISAPTNIDQMAGGVPFSLRGLALVEETATKVTFVSAGSAMWVSEAVSAGIFFGEIDVATKRMRFSYGFLNTAAAATFTFPTDVCMLTTRRGVHVYARSSDSYPAAMVFDV